MICKYCNCEFVGNFCPNCGAPALEQTPVENNKSIPEAPINNPPIQNSVPKENRKIRTGMKIGMIICFSFAGLFALTSIAVPSLISVMLFFSVLGVMFLFIGISPKENKYMFDQPNGMQKITFVIISIIVAFTLFGFFIGVLESAPTTTNDGTSQVQDDNSNIYIEDVSSDNSLSTESKAEESSKPSTSSHIHSYKSATCTAPQKCSCGATKGSALGHSFKLGKCSRCGTSDPNYSSVSVSKLNALKKAKSYLNYSAFSYEGLIHQLEYEKFSNEDAVYGADNCGANWNEQALKKAKSYLDYTSFSYSGLVKQLEYEKFTSEQAKYGADNCGANWNEQAAKKAASYMEFSAFSRQGLIGQLKYEGFTDEQAEYGANSVGL